MTGGTIAALCVLAIGALYGAYKGVLKMAFGLISWIIVLVFLFAATPHINRFLTEQTPLEPFLYEKTQEYMNRQSSDLWERIAETSGESFDAAAGESLSGLLDEIRGQLPDSLNQKIDAISEAISSGTENAIQSAKDAAQKTASQTIQDSTASLAATWTKYLIQGISLLLAWLAAMIVIAIAKALIHTVDKAPVIHGISHTLGAGLGLLIGLLYLWVALVAADIFSITSWGAQIRVWVQESALLSLIAHYNPLMTLLH